MGNRRVLERSDFAVHEQRTPSPAGADASCKLRRVGRRNSRRVYCDGELEWINVVPEPRGSALGSELLPLLAAWFTEQKASRICVDVDQANTTARRFYKRHGADNLNEHWLVWNDIRVAVGRR